MGDRLDAAPPDPLSGLAGAPRLLWPTTAVRDSYLAGERDNSLDNGTPLDWLDRAADDFGAHVRERRGVRTRWGVPSTAYWYVAGREYLGTLIIRHRLTPELTRIGGHIGYHVAPAGACDPDARGRPGRVPRPGPAPGAGHLRRRQRAVPPGDSGQRRGPR